MLDKLDKNIEELISYGKKEGVITQDEIAQKLVKHELSPEDIEVIKKRLEGALSLEIFLVP